MLNLPDNSGDGWFGPIQYEKEQGPGSMCKHEFIKAFGPDAMPGLGVMRFGGLTVLSNHMEALGVYHAAGLAVSSFPDMCFRDSFLLGHPGFAWAARREVMTKVGRRFRSTIARTRTRTRTRTLFLSLTLARILPYPYPEPER